MRNEYSAWLDSHDRTLVLQRQAALETESAAHDYLNKLSDLDKTILVAKSCLGGNLTIVGYKYNLSSMSEELVTELSRHPVEFRDALLYCLGGQERRVASSHIQNAAWMLAAQILGRYVASEMPVKPLLYLYIAQDRHPPQMYSVIFRESFTQQLSSDSGQREKWVAFFRDYAKICYMDCINDVFHPRNEQTESIDSLQLDWNQNSNPWAILENRSYSFHIANFDHIPFVLTLFFHLDKMEWLQLIETLPLPQLIWGCVNPIIQRGDSKELIILIRNAPLMFGVQGEWLRHSSILLLVNAVTLQAKSIHGRLLQLETWNWSNDASIVEQAKQRRQEFEKTGAEERFKKAYNALLTRSDGREIALFFLRKYIRECTFGFDGQIRNTRAVEYAALNALAEKLRNHGVSVQSLCCRWLNEEKSAQSDGTPILPVYQTDASTPNDDAHGEGARTLRVAGLPQLLNAASLWYTEHDVIHTPNPSKTDDAWVLWTWFDYLLQGYDSQLTLLMQTGRIVTYSTALLGHILASCPNPSKQWQLCYRSLEPQRHRIRYRESAFRWRFGSSEILNTVALIAWELLAQQPGNKFGNEYISNFMDNLFQSTWFLFLTARQGIATSRDYIERLVIDSIVRFVIFSPITSLDMVKGMLGKVEHEDTIIQGVKQSLAGISSRSGYKIDLDERLQGIGMSALARGTTAAS